MEEEGEGEEVKRGVGSEVVLISAERKGQRAM